MKRITTLAAFGLLLAVAMLTMAGAAVAKKPAAPPPVTIQILNVSDWHGNLDPVNGFGGAWNLSARWQQDRTTLPTLTLTAGDDFGATPALSNFFNEEPAVKAQRMMGIKVGTLGNHNFDRGLEHLQQMIDLAGAPTSSAAPGQPYKYVSANLKKTKGQLDGVDPVAYFNVGGAKVAVIGITNEEAPGLVLPGRFGDVQITDGVAAAKKYARAARKDADVVVVITHKGVRDFVGGQPVGELIDFANAMDPDLVDVIVGDHTDVQYSGTINGILVHENRSFGVTYAKTLITVQPGVKGAKHSAVLSKSVSFVSPGPSGSLGSNRTSCTGGTTGNPPIPDPAPYCDQAIVDMLVPYRVALAELLDEPLGATTLPFDRGGNIERRQEVPLGDLITDGMRWKYNTQLALMNAGGIRSQLPTCSYQPTDATLKRGNYGSDRTTITTCPGYAAGAPYDVVLGDVYSVLPFSNLVGKRTVTGQQLWTALENGVSQIGPTGMGADGRFPQISGFKFTFHYLNPVGSRVTSVALADGTPITNDASTTYTIALPNFVNLGGDGYAVFKGTPTTEELLDAAVMKEYLESFGATPADRFFNPSSYPLDRITKLP